MQRVEQLFQLLNMRFKVWQQREDVVVCNIPPLLALRDQARQSLGVRGARGSWLVLRYRHIAIR